MKQIGPAPGSRSSGDVEIVVDDELSVEDSLTARLADAAGEIFGTEPHQTWVRLRTIPIGRYAENRGGPAEGAMPIFVTVLKAIHPASNVMSAEIRRLTDMIASLCQRPAENVHVLYLPEASGRIAFGGNLVEK